MITVVTIYYRLPTLNNNPPPPCQCLGDKILKKNLREMFIEQIIEFELRGTGPSGHTCNPKTGYFHEKTKKKLQGKQIFQ